MMLFRYMMIVFLLIVSALPAWANTPSNSSDWKEAFIQRYHQQRSESPLSKLTVMTKDWREGDTYCIRYTLTNPTSESIKKELSRIQVSYNIFDSDNNETICNQYSDAISKLCIPANSDYTVTVRLPLPTNDTDVRIEYTETLWEFTDRSFFISSFANEKSPFRLALDISPDGEASVLLKNSSDSQTISELRSLIVRTRFTPDDEQTSQHFYFSDDKAYTLTVNPNETITIPLPKKLPLAKKSFKLNSYVVDADINDVHHKNVKLFGLPIAQEDDTFRRIAQKTHYYPPFALVYFPLDGSGAFTIDGDTVHCYIRIKNTDNAPLSLDQSSITARLIYYDQAFLGHIKKIKFNLPDELTIQPNEEKYFTCSALLPSDFKINYSIMNFSFDDYSATFPQLLIQADRAPINAKASYIDIGEVSMESLTSKKENLWQVFPYPVNWVILGQLSPTLLIHAP